MSSYQTNQIKLINTSLIDPHPDNPRKNIGDVTDLAASIKTNGLLTPLSVVPNGSRYRVIAGHRRLMACKQAGIGFVPCFVLQLDPLQQLEAMVTENCQREQLTVLEEADAIQGMLDLGATTASVAHRLGRSGDYVRDRAKAASIDNEVRRTRDDFSQLTIGQLVAIARYDGQPDRQKKLAQAAGTSNFDYILRNIERDDRDRQWIESVAALLAEPDNGFNLIPDPPYSNPEWRYAGCMFPSTGTPEETIEKIREQNPAAVSIHMEQVSLWTRRDKTADDEKEARRAAEQAERDARRHALEEYAAACAQKQFATIAGIEPEQALAELRYHLDEPDWAVWAVQILAARIEWFIDPTDWTTVNDTSRRIPGYYQILQDLGYTPTDDETSHLDQLIHAITEADSDENEEDEENNQ